MCVFVLNIHIRTYIYIYTHIIYTYIYICVYIPFTHCMIYSDEWTFLMTTPSKKRSTSSVMF